MSDKYPKNVLVNDPGWQKVRQSLLGKWNLQPEWCCEQLKKYLGDISSTSKDKMKVVQNYLTSSAFRIGKIKHSCIIKLRMQLAMERKKRISKNEW